MIDVDKVFAVPVKREDLASVFGVGSDREARRILSDLQMRYNIINLQDGKGYFLADDETALRYAEQERRRAIKSFLKANAMIKRCRGATGIEVPVRAHMRRIAKTDKITPGQIIFSEVER